MHNFLGTIFFSIHQNIFLASHYIILKLYHMHLIFSFCVLSLLNLKKGSQIFYYSNKICKNYIYCYILDLIYYSFINCFCFLIVTGSFFTDNEYGLLV